MTGARDLALLGLCAQLAARIARRPLCVCPSALGPTRVLPEKTKLCELSLSLSQDDATDGTGSNFGNIVSSSSYWHGAIFRTLQTNNHRHSVGIDSPVPYDDRFHDCIRTDCKPTIGWSGALRVDGVCRDAALELLFNWAGRCCQ